MPPKQGDFMYHGIQVAGLLLQDEHIFLIKHTMDDQAFWVPPMLILLHLGTQVGSDDAQV